jgi:O-antigen/teichoic acid export membrane protein
MTGDRSLLARLHRLGGLDFPVLTTLLLRSWQIVAGGVMVVFIPVWLSKVAQGYYFTFSSLVALAVFFELGFHVVVTQLVGHEMAHVSVSLDGALVGDARRLDRLASLARLLHRWYRVASVLFFLAVGAAGILFFSRNATLPPRDWAGAWLLLVAAAAGILYLSPFLAFAEGLGKVGEVARVRALASVVGYLLMWTALSLGAGLWAVWVVPAVAVAATLFWLHHHDRWLAGVEARPITPTAESITWRDEILPLQWRIGVTWASSYVTLYLFTPAIFATQGAVEAGRVGLAFSIFNAIQTMGMSWIYARTPVFANLVASGKRGELHRAFRAATTRSAAFVLTACAGVLVAAWALRAFGSPIAERVADLPILACIGAVTVLNTVGVAMQTYMRAHKKEPVLVASVVGAILTGSVALLATPHGVLLTMLLYLLVTVGVVLPWTWIVFRRYYR